MLSTDQGHARPDLAKSHALNTCPPDPVSKTIAARCSNCALRQICMPSDLSAGDLVKLDTIISSSRAVKRGEALYRAGDPFQSIYAVRAGSFKTVVIHRDGREQVTGFHIPGEPLGMDGISIEIHTCDAIALEDSSICIIPFHLLELLCRELKVMQHHVHKMMSGEIVRESGLMMMLGNMSADERVAAFLLNISTRLAVRGYSPLEFNLRMTRDEMGSYLGMTLETVSRMFSKFQKQRLIEAQGKKIRILDIDGLKLV
jgi:CRP/FNR family transcriptional regulator, anaerobic regulatory protein